MQNLETTIEQTPINKNNSTETIDMDYHKWDVYNLPTENQLRWYVKNLREQYKWLRMIFILILFY